MTLADLDGLDRIFKIYNFALVLSVRSQSNGNETSSKLLFCVQIGTNNDISAVASSWKAIFCPGGRRLFGFLPVPKNDFLVVVAIKAQEVDHFRGIDEDETNKNRK